MTLRNGYATAWRVTAATDKDDDRAHFLRFGVRNSLSLGSQRAPCRSRDAAAICVGLTAVPAAILDNLIRLMLLAAVTSGVQCTRRADGISSCNAAAAEPSINHVGMPGAPDAAG
jgi:hypothetical protein